MSSEVTKAEERGLERLILFSDAVVAIAITLLVLPLTELRPEEGQSAWDFVRQQGDEVLAFAISFAVIARFWFAHHAMFQYLVRMDRPLLLLNTAWLASVVLLPFPTGLLNERGYYATLYLANLLLTSVLTGALGRYIDGHPRLVDASETLAEKRGNRYFGFILVGSILLALIGSLFWESAALFLLLIIPIAQRVVDRVTRGSADSPARMAG